MKFKSFIKPFCPALIRLALALLAWLAFGGVAGAMEEAKPLLHPLFSDHAVLQRGERAPVWGWAAPGDRITMTFAGQTHDAVARTDGRWLVRLDPLRASTEPRRLTVVNTTTGETITRDDVLVGDVWLCSGQSNMEMGIELCHAEDAIAASADPLLRLLTVPKRAEAVPLAVTDVRWLPCNPETLKQGAWGGFSAAAYFFGREIRRAEPHLPIGLIHSSWGGTIAEAWTSREGLTPLGDFKERLDWLQSAASSPDKYLEIYENWCQQKDTGTQQGWATAATVDDSWKTVAMPQEFGKIGLDDFDGFAWFRHEFNLPADWAGKDLQINLGKVDDMDTTWINGVKIGQMNKVDTNRNYTIPAAALQPGKNIVTVRVLDTGGLGGLEGRPDDLWIAPAGGERLSLAGDWQMRVSTPLAQTGPPPPTLDGDNPNLVTVLYHGMIAPLLPYAIKGTIWYQGESNAGRAEQYRRLLPAMIGDWRHRFGVGNFPFYIVSLANYTPTNAVPRDNDWAELREAQALTAKNIPHSGLAVAIDIGDAGDIHPKNKAEVGRRLALNALAQTYGQKIEFSGPWFHSMKVDDNKIVLKFTHADGLNAKGDALTGFAIAGEDRQFVWANAVIVGQTVVVSSPEVPRPVAVRYAWDSNPLCNLYNAAGLPAVPFRTDDWPMMTHGKQ